MKNEQAPGAIPPLIPQAHGCFLPTKPQPTKRPAAQKRAAVPPKPEPTLEQKIADEVERSDKFVFGFIIGELLGSLWANTIESEAP